MKSNQAKPLKSVWAKAGEELGNFLTEGEAEEQILLAWMPTEGKLANKSACQESYSSVKSGRSLA